MESNEKIRETVRQGYTEIAKNKSSCCCGSLSPQQLAEEIGYSKEELDILPEDANMGLSCGNPTAIANLKPGQVVRVYNVHGCPKANTMGHCYVQDEAGTFLGLVHTNSLRKVTKDDVPIQN